MSQRFAPGEVRRVIGTEFGPDSLHPAIAVGPASTPVRVWLQGRSVSDAKRLVARFGPAVDVMVGLTPYTGPEWAIPPPEWELPHPHLELVCEPKCIVVSPGTNGRVSVTVRNVAANHVQCELAGNVAVLCDPRDHAVVGTYRGWRAAVRRVIDLGPDDHISLQLAVGARRVGQSDLNAGRYEIVAPLRFFDRSGDGRSWHLLSRGAADLRRG